MPNHSYSEREARYYMQVVNRLPLELARGEGARVYDRDGREYLDLTAGWSCLNIGHSHPAVVAAIAEQAAKLTQMTNLFYTEPQLRLAEMLVSNSALDRVFFTNSGAEANEGACKLARKWGRVKLGGAHEIITALNSFHGRTLAMTAATGQPEHQERWRPLTPGFINVPFDDVEAVKRATGPNTCAVLVEPVQGEGGVNVPSPDYLPALRRWCSQNNILLMLDEVQTGMGRLGALFGHQLLEGAEPDVMTLAKALGGGTPLGAFMCREACAVLEPGDHGSTFGGNALTTAAGAATLELIIADDLPRRAREMGALFKDAIAELAARHRLVKGPRGVGLLLGIELEEEQAADVVRRALEEGVIVNAVRPGTIRLLPPLTITADEARGAMAALGRVFTDLEG